MTHKQHHGPRSPRICPDCKRAIEQGGDEAGVCINCGGRNIRVPSHSLWAWVEALIERVA